MTSTESSTVDASLLQAGLPIGFLIIGGGIAGLACALALRRVGHSAMVLEKGDRSSATVRGNGGVRLPPNVTKIFFQWGLRDVLKQRALISQSVVLAAYESGDYIGRQIWDQDLLRETQGVFMLLAHAELYDILYDAAIRADAQVRFNAEVAQVDAKICQVTLSSGETLSGAVLVGADGEYGITRTTVVGQQVRGRPTGLVMYDTVVSGKHLPEQPSPLSMAREQNGVFVAFGDTHAIVAYPLPHEDDYAFQFYGFDDEKEGRYGESPSVTVHDVSPTIDPRLHRITKNASKAVRIVVRGHSDLKDWLHEDGRLVLIGEAAHPFPPGTIQATAMAVEDGAVLAKLFSHLTSPRQIKNFLYAFQELRQARVNTVCAEELNNTLFMAMPACEAPQRDAGMRALGACGANVLEGGDGEASGLWEQVRTVFGYDCEDAADEWWVMWGILRERSLRREVQDGNEDTGGAVDELLCVCPCSHAPENSTPH